MSSFDELQTRVYFSKYTVDISINTNFLELIKIGSLSLKSFKATFTHCDLSGRLRILVNLI